MAMVEDGVLVVDVEVARLLVVASVVLLSIDCAGALFVRLKYRDVKITFPVPNKSCSTNRATANPVSFMSFCAIGLFMSSITHVQLA